MSSGLPRGAALASIVSFVLGGYMIYSGLGMADTGLALASSGENYSDIFQAFGGMWKLLGWLYALFGVLCFPIAIGLIMVKEWARKSGFTLFLAITIMSFLIGVILVYYSPLDGILMLVVASIWAVMTLKLRSGAMKAAYEFRGQGKRYDSGSGADYRDVYMATREEKMEKRYAKKVNMRGPARQEEPDPAPKARKCPRCNTMNMGEQQFCKMCGREM